MFRQGKPRTFIHNLKLASMLSFVAGIVNINGVLAAQTLTTNVTGHFAFFTADFVQHRYQHALMFILYILFFLLGAFVCSILLEMFLRVRPAFSHAVPMFIEMTLLITVAFNFFLMNDYVIACVLLFAMGLQNALVTRISKSTVRTTHLTGLFTDLGIELSQLFFYKLPEESKKLRRSIYLRIVIILFFFFGGVLGGFLYLDIGLKALLLAAVTLVIALSFDFVRFSLLYYPRKFFKQQS